jgi:hypothetical protein
MNGAAGAKYNSNVPLTPQSPDSVRGVVDQTTSHLDSLEMTLTNILDRLQGPSDAKNRAGEVAAIPCGVVSAANLMRNQASRCQDLAQMINNLI